MTPRFHINYLFVRPEWEGSQIGEFMLYHLIQVSLINYTYDLTLTNFLLACR